MQYLKFDFGRSNFDILTYDNLKLCDLNFRHFILSGLNFSISELKAFKINI